MPPAGTGRPRRDLRRARRWIAAGAVLGLVAIGLGLHDWRAPPRPETAPGQRPALRSGPVTCAAMPKALAGAFADQDDCALIERTLRQALATAEAGTITRWTNTRSKTSGTIKLSGAESREGNVCRRAELSVTRAGETKRAEAVLCLKQGAWVLVE